MHLSKQSLLVKLLSNVDKLIALQLEANGLLVKFKAASIHQWETPMADKHSITYDLATLKLLYKRYTAAVLGGQTEFTFEDQPLLVAYAKYLLEYMELEVMRRAHGMDKYTVIAAVKPFKRQLAAHARTLVGGE